MTDVAESPSPGFRNRIIRSGTADPNALKANPLNWRSHPVEQREALGEVLDEVGWVGRVMINVRTGLMVDGHLRVELAVERGESEIPVDYVDLSEAEEKLILATFDPIAALATKHTDRAEELIRDIDNSTDVILAGLADRMPAITSVLDEVRPSIVPSALTDEQAPPAPLEPKTRPGDLIVMGDHRLLCGDSADAGHVARLLDGQPIHLVNTDPPYNVKVEPRSNNAIASGLKSTKGNVPAAQRKRAGKHHQQLDLARHPGKSKPTGRMRAKDRVLDNDFLPPEEFRQLLGRWFGNLAGALQPGRSFYLWGGYSNIANYPQAIQEAGLYFSQAVIWVKEHPVLTRKDFMGNHEWAYYGWKEGAAHYFHADIHNATDVWSVKKVNPQSMVHLTEKPVELAERAITYSSKRGENVLDLFAGSGSTLIGCQRTGRRAFLMELDPAYCDVIVQRWQEFTGERAEGWRGN